MQKNVSGLFRLVVVVHLASLYLLTFGIRSTLVGLWHVVVAIGLTVLMLGVFILFVRDMAAPRDLVDKTTKLVDALVGIAWLFLMAFLIHNSLRTGIW